MHCSNIQSLDYSFTPDSWRHVSQTYYTVTKDTASWLFPFTVSVTSSQTERSVFTVWEFHKKLQCPPVETNLFRFCQTAFCDGFGFSRISGRQRECAVSSCLLATFSFLSLVMHINDLNGRHGREVGEKSTWGNQVSLIPYTKTTGNRFTLWQINTLPEWSLIIYI